ncbi:MAG: methyltransferase [Desulfobulbus sp.]|nr:methyltransferase [Desulfobulbus sp.]
MPEVDSRPALTQDTLFAGELICNQPENGYRFSMDAVLAAQFSVPKARQRLLDLGCGCGIIGLILAYRVPELVVHGVEVQPELAGLAQENIRANGFSSRMDIIEGNVCVIDQLVQAETYDQVVCNPPYGSPNGGRINLHGQAAVARHELSGSLEDFVQAAAFSVRNRGRVVFIYPARRGATLLHTLNRYRLTPKRMQPIYSYPGSDPARLLLVEAVKNGGEQFEVLAPIYIYQQQNGPYSLAMQAFYRENPCSPR